MTLRDYREDPGALEALESDVRERRAKLARKLCSPAVEEPARWCELFEASRRELGLTASRLSTLFNVGSSTIRRWRRGDNAPPLSYRRPLAMKLARLLGEDS